MPWLKWAIIDEIFTYSFLTFQVSKDMTKEQINAVFEKFDNNKDGQFNREDFRNLMYSKMTKEKRNVVPKPEDTE